MKNFIVDVDLLFYVEAEYEEQAKAIVNNMINDAPLAARNFSHLVKHEITDVNEL